MRWIFYRLTYELILLFSEVFCAYFEYSLKTLRMKLLSNVYLYVDTAKESVI